MRVTFLISEYSLHNFLIEEYLRARPNDHVSIVKVRLVIKGRSRSETAARILPKLSRRFLSEKLLEALFVLGVTALPKLLPRGAVFRRLSRIAAQHQLPLLVTENIESPDVLAFLEQHRPQLLISLFHQIVKEPLLTLPEYGVLNIHPGLLPDFKGIQPYCWSLSEGAARAGATIHSIVDSSIDTGPIFGQTSYEQHPGMSVQLNYYLTMRAAAALLPRVVESVESGRIVPRPQPAGGQYYRWPDSAAYDRLLARGHRVFSFRDLIAILWGRYDHFTAERSSVEEVTSAAT